MAKYFDYMKKFGRPLNNHSLGPEMIIIKTKLVTFVPKPFCARCPKLITRESMVGSLQQTAMTNHRQKVVPLRIT
ncbi:hypothetical protein O3V59_11150 [Brevibacillus thermoruber]|uniref:Uncharacterized protein n=1 Tax=Brevibacillus thermoruber TaxID=33942 RepID=A0A9X3Z3N5_9BACL|nr:hypothetical protein [Brevibacillus thermoruber]MDA5108918.1 hypothetical protein [Brevibacillus thermoruber]